MADGVDRKLAPRVAGRVKHMDLDRLMNVLQFATSQALQLVWADRTASRLPGYVAQQDLSRLGELGDASRDVDPASEPIIAPLNGCAGVHADANTQRAVAAAEILHDPGGQMPGLIRVLGPHQ